MTNKTREQKKQTYMEFVAGFLALHPQYALGCDLHGAFDRMVKAVAGMPEAAELSWEAIFSIADQTVQAVVAAAEKPGDAAP